jgi:hypothetical protein
MLALTLGVRGIHVQSNPMQVVVTKPKNLKTKKPKTKEREEIKNAILNELDWFFGSPSTKKIALSHCKNTKIELSCYPPTAVTKKTPRHLSTIGINSFYFCCIQQYGRDAIVASG